MHKVSLPGVYRMTRPDNALPLVFDSPHSGMLYPADFDYACDFTHLEKAEDRYVDQLFEGAPNCGAAFLAADFPRSYIDVNRCVTDIDPEILEEQWPEVLNPSQRSQAGIGLVRRLVRPGMPVYNRALTVAQIRARIDNFYLPYHAALETLIDDAYKANGQVWHVNCHSMPPQSSFAGQPGLFRAYPARNPDFVLGDRDGTTCSLDFTHALRDHLRHQGYTVAINDPYKGVELVYRYSDPAAGRHSIQIEVCKSLYLEEDLVTKSNDFKALKADIDTLIGFCADYVRAQDIPLAAD